jgi:hypothetical protein
MGRRSARRGVSAGVYYDGQLEENMTCEPPDDVREQAG